MNIEYDGRIWGQDKDGYFKGNVDGKDYRLHRYIWEQHNGKIPKGMLIHHIDENIYNNNIDNLQLISQTDHNKIHHNGFNHSTAARKKMSTGQLKRYKDNPEEHDKCRHFLGKKHTPETKEKMRQSALIREANKRKLTSAENPKMHQ